MQLDRYRLIYEWCSEALECLKPHLIEESRLAFSDLIQKERNSGSIYDTAVDIAIMIDSLSPKERATVDAHLTRKNGISSVFFLDTQLKKARKILQKGAIRTDAEYELIRNVTLDQEIPPNMAVFAEQLLAKFESPNR